jgi:hypothetical protein
MIALVVINLDVSTYESSQICQLQLREESVGMGSFKNCCDENQ